jgi:hypothetical protein
LHFIDGELLGTCEADDPSAVAEHVELQGGRPFFDIEVIRAPWVDLSGPDDQLQARFLERMETLREQFGIAADALLSYQEPRFARDGQEPCAIDSGEWAQTLSATADRYNAGRWLSVAPGSCMTSNQAHGEIGAEPRDIVAIFHLHGAQQQEALLAVVGLDPAIPGERRGGEDCLVTRLVRTLAKGAGRAIPLYLLCIVPEDTLAAGPGAQRRRRFLQRLRPSLVVHGGEQTSALMSVTATDLRDEQPMMQQLSLVSCPTFKAGEGTPGIARLRMDITGGAVNLAFRHDLGPDRKVGPIQVLQPLQSASRVSGAEHGLYVKVTGRLSSAQAESDALRATHERITELREHIERVWTEDGYVALCGPTGGFPEITPERTSKYNLLVLLRERPDGDGHDLLLSNHTPLNKPMVARWDTLLLPAFKKPTDLLARLRDDVVRQAVTQTEELERSERARSFESAVAELLKERGTSADDVSPVSQEPFTTIKFSPTDGLVTEYEYTFVTLPWLVKERATSEQAPRQSQKIIDWLNGLPAVRPDGGGIPLEALKRGGAGVRWEPDSGLASRADSRQRRRATQLPRGVVWFPFDERQLWRVCPSVVARNVDVMLQLEQRLAEIDEGGQYPSRLLLATDR